MHFNLNSIKGLTYDEEDKKFYLLFNKYQEKLGLYLMQIDELIPEKDYKFIIKWTNKLDIADAKCVILENKAYGYKELIISFKTIYVNTYTVQILDISNI